MMKLNIQNLRHENNWTEKGYKLPAYDIEAVAKKTGEQPEWLHVGAGNIFRIFPAILQQQLLNEEKASTGIIVTEIYDEEIIESAFSDYDNLSIAVTLESSGYMKKEVVGSIVETVKPQTEYKRLEEIFCSPSLRMVSFTITEKGYTVKGPDGRILPWIQQDLELSKGDRPACTIGMITHLCYRRYLKGKLPLALVSMDNCSHNGTILRDSVMFFAESWVGSGLCEPAFLDFLSDPAFISFPWSMIDKITPRPSEEIVSMLEADGLEDIGGKKTARNTYVAPFVNAESSQYLAIEDAFPNGRPPLEETGVIFSDKSTIDKIEKMKVCTCLNPLHTVLAVFGCLLGYTSIAEEMKNKDLEKLIRKIGYEEGLPVAVDPGIISAEAFMKDAIEVRFPNPFVPDTPQRIATDTSLKIPVRFGETLKAYVNRGDTDLSFLIFIPLFFAGWLRYLMGIDDAGNSFELSPDPNIPELQKILEGIRFGEQGGGDEQLKQLLCRKDIFGIDLYEYGLGMIVEQIFSEMNKGPRAIEKTIQNYLNRQ